MDLISNIISLVAGLIAGWTLRIVYTSYKSKISVKSSDNNYNVKQTGNKVSHGSVVGRDQNNSHH